MSAFENRASVPAACPRCPPVHLSPGPDNAIIPADLNADSEASTQADSESKESLVLAARSDGGALGA